MIIRLHSHKNHPFFKLSKFFHKFSSVRWILHTRFKKCKFLLNSFIFRV